MKVFMYNKDLAIKNNCHSEKDPNSIVKFIIIMISLLICIAIFGPIILLLLGLKGILYDVLKYIIIFSCVFSIIYYIYYFIRWRSKFGAPQHTAIIKENNTFWAVRLTFIPEIGGSVNINTATSALSTASNIKKMQYNQKMLKELYNDREVSEKYIDALNESRKSNVNIMRDIGKNFKYIFNGRSAVIRLDNLKFIKEKKDSEIYSYTDNNNKIKKIEIFKVYPNLKEEIINTQQDNHNDKFPQFTEEHKKTFKTNNKAFIIIGIITVILLVLGIRSVNYDCSDRLTDEDIKYAYNYIETNYGAGDKFITYSKEIECFEYNDDILGTEITIIGYFDNNDENAYIFRFQKLDKEHFNYEIGKMRLLIGSGPTGYSKAELQKNEK